jgi:hypothetical protein
MGHKKPILLLLVVMVGYPLFATPSPVRATSPFGLDGNGTPYACLQFNCRAEQLSTIHGNDLVILLVACDAQSCTSQALTILDSSGLKYTLRAVFQSGDDVCCYHTQLAEYYAVTRAPLNSDIITILYPDTFPDFVDQLAIFAVKGYNSQNPFDLSTPSFVDCLSIPTPPCSDSITTSTPAFVFAGIQKFIAGCPVPSGWIRLFGFSVFFDSDYQTLGQPGTVGASYTCVSRQGFQSVDILMMDAISLHTI